MTHTDEKIDLVINQMTQSQYDQAKLDGDLNANEIYVTETLPPSKTSDLVNDSGFITASALPSKTSDLVNDSGFITTSSSEFVAKRDKTDMSVATGTRYDSWILSTYYDVLPSPIELKWGTYVKDGIERQGWAATTSNGDSWYVIDGDNQEYFNNCVKNSDGSFSTSVNEMITYSEDELSMVQIGSYQNVVCTRQSKDPIPTYTQIATQDWVSANTRQYDDISYWASVDTTGAYKIESFSIYNPERGEEWVLDQFDNTSDPTWTRIQDPEDSYISTVDGTSFNIHVTSRWGYGVGTATFTANEHQESKQVTINW